MTISEGSSFIGADTAIDANKKVNGRKGHVSTDTLGLAWGVVVEAANKSDARVAEQVLAPLQGYMHGMKKILAHAAYEKVFMEWVSGNLLGVNLEISYAPAHPTGFVPVRRRWVSEGAFGMFNFFPRLAKDDEKTTESAQAWASMGFMA